MVSLSRAGEAVHNIGIIPVSQYFAIKAKTYIKKSNGWILPWLHVRSKVTKCSKQIILISITKMAGWLFQDSRFNVNKWSSRICGLSSSFTKFSHATTAYNIRIIRLTFLGFKLSGTDKEKFKCKKFLWNYITVKNCNVADGSIVQSLTIVADRHRCQEEESDDLRSIPLESSEPAGEKFTTSDCC